MKVTIIGSGYVGLTTGAALGYLGHQVTLLDIDERKIALLRKGKSPIHERGLEEVLQSAREKLFWKRYPCDRVYCKTIWTGHAAGQGGDRGQRAATKLGH